MTTRQLATLAALGSFALLAGAFVFQAFGYAPCKMCIWQRWPHGAAIAVGVVFLLAPQRLFLLAGAAMAALTASIGAFHAGVEQKWWEGPSDCTGGGLGNLTGAELLSTETRDKLVMCDEIAWAFLGLSMPAWNALLSFLLFALWLAAFKRS